MAMRVIALAGGVGGAKMVSGLAGVLPSESLIAMVNTGDDFEHLGLTICPDLDTVVYTLADLGNPQTGWGRKDETWNFLETLDQLNGPTWFRLGDRDLALHHERTRRLSQGQPLSGVTEHLCQQLGVAVKVLPMSDQPVRTIVISERGELSFQDYFVAQKCEPRVSGFRFEGIAEALPAPGVLEALQEADLVVMCPSNPWVSLDPILAIAGVREAIAAKRVVGVSPIVGGKAIRGPAAKMYSELGADPSALTVAEHYRDLLTHFVIDRVDQSLADDISRFGVNVRITDTVMRTESDRIRLAGEILDFALEIVEGQGVK